ncbi:MAG: hypothetical protein RR841_07130, partial [Eubacterium sp.]
MKKRASLLISGITTAALVVTAIGSFAAWSTLSAETGDFTATTDSRTEIKVTKLTTDPAEVLADKQAKLVPSGFLTDTPNNTIKDGNAKEKIAVGAFSVEK